MELSVHHDIHILHDRQIVYVLPTVSGIHPDCLRGVFFSDLLHQFSHISAVHGMHGISAGKGDSGNVWFLKLLKNLLFRSLVK